MSVKIAIVQKPPVALDRSRSIAMAAETVTGLASGGVELIVFPEAWIPGYPVWIWRLRPGTDRALSSRIHGRLLENAVDLAADHLDPLREAAARGRTTVVLGLHEIDRRGSGSTLFNTVVVIGPEGRILHRHRKLVPTHPERMVWGMGDGSGLRVVDTPVGRIGTLICWENYMPLARYALYAQGLEVLVTPTWDWGERWVASMRHIAREGGTWVLATATAMQGADIPEDFPGRELLFPDAGEWLNEGGALVVRPVGDLLAGPLSREKGVLFAEIDPGAARRARRLLDVTGHYSRPDIFHLAVDRASRPPVVFVEEEASSNALLPSPA
ncbi:MAG TPA: carbon-nitrogen hydrolase family protein [Acidobacteria bacterium]|nr:carbon-nitrogen hydrolase family protein [Acidobacteriota bacterium]